MLSRSRSALSLFVVGTALAGCTSSSSKVDGGSTKPVATEVSVAEAPEAPEEPATTTASDPQATEATDTRDLSEFDRQFPVDDGVTIGTLDNGLTYYIRENDNPGGKVQMRLAINAGSAVEDPDQSAVAHFLEHMLFNGTAKYPANELVEVLQSFGSEFGPDINAYTSYDETVYELSLPTDDSAIVEAGFDILHQWLTAATLDEDLVTGERGVVLDEWRQSEQSFGGRVGATIAEMLFTGTPFEGRDPIGTEEAIKAMTPDLLRRFYDDWYRPDNAAILVVGDIDGDDMEAQIEAMFSDATSRGSNPPRPDLTIDSYTTPGVGSLVDPETSDGFVEVTLALPASTDRSVAGARREVITALAYDIIATRLTDDEKLGDTPFAEVRVDSNNWFRAIDAPSLVATTVPGGAAESLDALAVEIERVRRFGVTQGELERALAPYESAVRDAYDSRETRQDTEFVSSYVDHFLAGTPIPDAESEHEIMQAILASIIPDDIADSLDGRWTATAPQVLLVAPETDTVALPTDAEVLALWEQLGERDIDQRDATEPTDGELMAVLPEPVAEVSSESVDGDPGWYVEPTLLTFPNGARVYLNPTAITEGALAFQATSPGGYSLVADADVANASVMPQIAMNSGLGDLDAVGVSQVLAGASIDLSPYLDSTSENLAGSAATEDVETLLQVLHLTMTAPQFDQNALDDAITEITPYVEDPTVEPEFAAQIALNTARYGDERRMALLPTPEEMASFDLEAMERIWDERFGNASDWTFAIVGDFDIDETTELVRRYIGSLPGNGTTEEWGDVEIDPPAGIVQDEVIAGSGDKASLTIQFSGPTEGGVREQALTDLAAEILTNRLTEHVREALGASYSPFAAAYLYEQPDLLIETTIAVTGSAPDVDRLASVVQEDLATLRSDGTGGAEWDAALEAMVQRYSYINNDVIASQLLSLADDPSYDMIEALNIIQQLDSIGTDEFHDFIQRILPADQYIEIRLMPR